MEDRRARGEEHEKCDQNAKQLAERSEASDDDGTADDGSPY